MRPLQSSITGQNNRVGMITGKSRLFLNISEIFCNSSSLPPSRDGQLDPTCYPNTQHKAQRPTSQALSLSLYTAHVLNKGRTWELFRWIIKPVGSKNKIWKFDFVVCFAFYLFVISFTFLLLPFVHFSIKRALLG